MRRISDKYILQKFNREFDKVADELCNTEKDDLHDGVYGEEELLQMDRKNNEAATGGLEKPVLSGLNYLRFKEFLVKMGLLTEQQSN